MRTAINRRHVQKASFHQRIWCALYLRPTQMYLTSTRLSTLCYTICIRWSRFEPTIASTTWFKLLLLIYSNRLTLSSRKSQQSWTTAIRPNMKSLIRLTMNVSTHHSHMNPRSPLLVHLFASVSSRCL